MNDMLYFCADLCATLNCSRLQNGKASKVYLFYANNNILMIMRLACQFCTNHETLICLVKLFDYSPETTCC